MDCNACEVKRGGQWTWNQTLRSLLFLLFLFLMSDIMCRGTWSGVVWYDMMWLWYNVVWRDVVWYGREWCGIVWRCVVWCSVVIGLHCRIGLQFWRCLLWKKLMHNVGMSTKHSPSRDMHGNGFYNPCKVCWAEYFKSKASYKISWISGYLCFYDLFQISGISRYLCSTLFYDARFFEKRGWCPQNGGSQPNWHKSWKMQYFSFHISTNFHYTFEHLNKHLNIWTNYKK